ncbi:MAG: hypothetical protein V3V36_01305, partial [Candidatus Hydrothermarchaeaceae archaeon]
MRMQWILLIVLGLSLSVAPSVVGAQEIPENLSMYAGEQIEPEQARMLLEKLQGNQERINEYLESSSIPAPLKGFTS